MLAIAKSTRTSNVIRVQLPTLHRAQRTIKAGMGRFNVVCAGRRFGKDILAQDRAVYFALKNNAPTAWLAPSYRMLSDNYRMLTHSLASVITRKLNNERIDLIGGGFIDFWSLEQPDRVRGRKYRHVVINEAAMVANLEDAFNMVIAPTLVDLRGSCDFYSTPKGLNGFFNLYKKAVDIKSWERFRYTSYDNPTIPREELDMMVAILPDWTVRQEIMAEFMDDGSYFRHVDQVAVIEQPDEPEQHIGHSLFMGVDWALSRDWTVLAVGCQDCNRVVDWDRFNKIDFTYQRERLLAMAQRWHLSGAMPERNSIGEPNIELIRDHVFILNGPDNRPGFNTTSTTKPPLIQRLATALEHEGFLVPQAAADELRAYEVEIMSSGHPKFGAPEGKHDDWVMALALLRYAMTAGNTWLIA